MWKHFEKREKFSFFFFFPSLIPNFLQLLILWRGIIHQQQYHLLRENYILGKTISFHFLLNLCISDKSKTFFDEKNKPYYWFWSAHLHDLRANFIQKCLYWYISCKVYPLESHETFCKHPIIRSLLV